MIIRPQRIRQDLLPGKGVYCAAVGGAPIRISAALPIATGVFHLIRLWATDFVAPAIRPRRERHVLEGCGTSPKGARLDSGFLISGILTGGLPHSLKAQEGLPCGAKPLVNTCIFVRSVSMLHSELIQSNHNRDRRRPHGPTCMVEKPHLDGLCSKWVVVINNSSRDILSGDGACPTRSIRIL